MKLLVTSDLHVDFGHTNKINFNTKEKWDLLIIAGDIANKAKIVHKYMLGLNYPLLWVAGNHDFWEVSSKERLTMSQSQELFNQIPGFLNRTITEIQGQRFLGCTLWYPVYTLFKEDWPDHQWIPDWQSIQEEGKKDVQFLIDNLQEGDIVITHMLPSTEVINSKYSASHFNRFFVNDITSLIKERNPKLWISGHSHEQCVRYIGKTLYVRNPRGYPNENNYLHVIVDTDKIGQYDAVVGEEVVAAV